MMRLRESQMANVSLEKTENIGKQWRKVRVLEIIDRRRNKKKEKIVKVMEISELFEMIEVWKRRTLEDSKED